MDVTCNRCGTVYEFEEGLIAATGTTVKCTQCGHLFKVHRSVPVTAPAFDEAPRVALRWRVRRVDGSTHTLESLAELTRLIAAGQFQRDDEISRTGQVWKPLGEIGELASLFERMPRARRRSEPPPEPQLSPTVAEQIPASAPEPEPTTPAENAEPQFEVLGVEVDLEARTQPISPLTEAMAAEAIEGRRSSSPELEPPPAAEVTVVPEPEPPEPIEPIDDELRRPPRSAHWVFGVALPLLVAAAIAGALLLRARQPKNLVDPARVPLARGDDALATYRPEGFERAAAEYRRALALHPDDAHVLSSLSRAYALHAEYLRSLSPPAARADAGAAQPGDRQQLSDQALLYARRAVQRNPSNVEASIALGDAERLAGNLTAAREQLERAHASEGVFAAQALEIEALLAIDEAHGDFKAGRTLAERALQKDLGSLRARFLFALCLIEGGELDAAQAELDALRRSEPDHPALAGLAVRLATAVAAAAVAATRPKPPAAHAQAAAREPAAPSPAREASSPSGKAGSAGPPSEAAQGAEDPIELCREGEAALERGATKTAQHAFERALELDPNSGRARTGLGYVALERSQPDLAVGYFRQAAKDGRAEGLIGLGDALRRLGKIREAWNAYQTYLKRYPNGARSSIAKRQSELLGEQLGESPQ